MKKTIILFVCMCTALISSAQLKVDSVGKVKIASNQTFSNSTLLVGNNKNAMSNRENVGIAGSPVVIDGKNNIGVLGAVSANTNFSSDRNFGVLGVVDSVNVAHGRNYGLCGMIGPIGANVYGGAGVYGTNYTYFLYLPANIQGSYAGYFDGPVKITGNLTIPSMFIPTDNRLNENIVSLGESEVKGMNTLTNLLGLDVIEYNTKGDLVDETIEKVQNEDSKEIKDAYECLKNEKVMMASRRHFGIDAEELQKIYPNLVLRGQDGYLAVNYVELVPLLIRSIQELKSELDEVIGNNKDEKITRGAERGVENMLGLRNSATNPVYASLAQNSPNPFSERTIIQFTLPEDTQNAYIFIFDMSGKMQKQIPINSSMESITIDGYELSAGMYIYSLVIGGKEIQTRRMILSK